MQAAAATLAARFAQRSDFTARPPDVHEAEDDARAQTVWRRERNSNPRYGFEMALAAESAVSIAFALLTRRLIRFRGALSERAVTSFEQLEEFGFGAADLIFYVPGLHGLGEGDHHFRQKV